MYSEKKAADAVKACMESPNPLRAAMSEVFTCWDSLGKYKDDDFGELEATIDVAREVFKLTEPSK